MLSIGEQYKEIVGEMVKNSLGHHVITEENVFQAGNPINRDLFYKIVEDLMLEGSTIEGKENLLDLYQRAQEGKSCLILMEHYSNFDLPCLFNLIERNFDQGHDIADKLIAIAGMKLNEENPLVLSFTEAFSRIVIYPSRSLSSIQDPQEREEEKRKSTAINMAAMKSMMKKKYSGNIILVFPSGTRYRPGDPSTKKGVKEIDTYIKSFDNMVMISINGNTLHVNEGGSMIQDTGHKDVMIYNVSPVHSTKAFRANCQENTPEGIDPRQYTVDKVMEILDELHNEVEPRRQEILKKLGAKE